MHHFVALAIEQDLRPFRVGIVLRKTSWDEPPHRAATQEAQQTSGAKLARGSR